MMTTVAIYLRLSLEDNVNQDESNSITNQRLLLKEFLRGKPEFDRCDIREYCEIITSSLIQYNYSYLPLLLGAFSKKFCTLNAPLHP